MNRVVYKLQLVRFDMVPGWGGHSEPRERERGRYLQANGDDVVIRGYAAALNRCGELNNAIKEKGQWENGWRFVPKQVTMENQEALFVEEPTTLFSGDQANAPA